MKIDFLDGLEVNEQDILTFEEGILGFEHLKEYILLNHDTLEEPVTFKWLQSIKDQDVGFMVAYPYGLIDHYEIELSEADVKALNLDSEEDVAVYVIITMAKEFIYSTANMKSPIVINSKNKKAKQIILNDTQYRLKYPFGEYLKQNLELK